jgi:hypothetical protein
MERLKNSRKNSNKATNITKLYRNSRKKQQQQQTSENCTEDLVTVLERQPCVSQINQV